MKVFISWSGERSKKVAELLDNWIQCVIQAVDPWMSSKDIDRGALWFTEINNELLNTSIGVICLTKENKDKPWILFEAGALAKGLSSNRVCTFLIDLKTTDLQDPLAQFNHSFPNRDSLFALVRTINASLKESALKEGVLEKVFETYWPQFEKDFEVILKSTPELEIKEKRDENEIILDVLSTVRMLDKRMRNIENSNNNSIMQKDLDGKLVLNRSYHGYLQDLMRIGLSENEIAEKMTDLGVSRHLTQQEINKILAKKEV